MENAEVIRHEQQPITHGQTSALSMKQVADRVNLVHQVLEKILKKGTHYGTVAGCGARMVLLKPGADVLAMTFQLVPQFSISRNDLENGHREFDVTCSMYSCGGILLGQGVGSCSTMEKKYRYRKDEKGGKIENEDIADVYNTVLKMAKKRAQVDATITVTGAADIFTQDLIDEDDDTPARSPVSEPKAKTKPAVDANSFEAVIDDVIVKSGEKNGNPWTRYGIKIGSDIYGTFSTDVGKVAVECKGSKVRMTWKPEGDYKTAVSIEPVASSEAQPVDDSIL